MDAWTAGDYLLYAQSTPASAWGTVYSRLTEDVPIGGTTTFSFVVTALDTPGHTSFDVRMYQVGEGFFGDLISVPIHIDPTSNQRGCGTVSHNLPDRIAPDAPFTAQVEIENTGAEDWPAGSCFYTQDTPRQLWGGPPCVSVPQAVPPGGRTTLIWAGRTPAAEGFYDFSRQVFFSGEGFINTSTACFSKTIEVSSDVPPPRDATLVSAHVPQTMWTGQTKILLIGMENLGTETWTSDGRYLLYSRTTPVGLWQIVTRPPLFDVAAAQVGYFAIPVVAPTTPGVHDSAFRMFRAGPGGGFFGDSFSNPVTVSSACMPGHPTKDQVRQTRVNGEFRLKSNRTIAQIFTARRSSPLLGIEVGLAVASGQDPGAQVELRLHNSFDQRILSQRIDVDALPRGPVQMHRRTPGAGFFDTSSFGCPPLNSRWEFWFSVHLVGASGRCESGLCAEGQVGQVCSEDVDCEVDVRVGVDNRKPLSARLYGGGWFRRSAHRYGVSDPHLPAQGQLSTFSCAHGGWLLCLPKTLYCAPESSVTAASRSSGRSCGGSGRCGMTWKNS